MLNEGKIMTNHKLNTVNYKKICSSVSWMQLNSLFQKSQCSAPTPIRSGDCGNDKNKKE